VWLTGLGLSVDYYDIRIADVLQSVGQQDTIDRCAIGQQIYCANLTRVNGALTSVRTRTENLSQARTTGVDIDLSWRTNLAGASTVFRLIGTRLLEQSTTVPAATSSSYIDRVGDIGLGYAKWIATGVVNVDYAAVGFNANVRYIGGGKFNTTYLPGDIAPQFAEVGSLVTVDLGAQYKLSFRGDPQFYINVANVFDRDPPLLPSSALVGGQTNVALYDTLGRYYTAGVRLRF
jgi:hypothetical protein